MDIVKRGQLCALTGSIVSLTNASRPMKEETPYPSLSARRYQCWCSGLNRNFSPDVSMGPLAASASCPIRQDYRHHGYQTLYYTCRAFFGPFQPWKLIPLRMARLVGGMVGPPPSHSDDEAPVRADRHEEVAVEDKL